MLVIILVFCLTDQTFVPLQTILYHYGPLLVYSISKIQVGTTPTIITVQGWFVSDENGLKPICQNGIQCSECIRKQNDAISTDTVLSCSQCDYKHYCHQVMSCHVKKENHGTYFWNTNDKNNKTEEIVTMKIMINPYYFSYFLGKGCVTRNHKLSD